MDEFLTSIIPLGRAEESQGAQGTQIIRAESKDSSVASSTGSGDYRLGIDNKPFQLVAEPYKESYKVNVSLFYHPIFDKLIRLVSIKY